jgi:hypothetical protein
LWKFSVELVEPSAGMGSFDCVRLSPHFAQDDNVGVGCGDRVICDWVIG